MDTPLVLYICIAGALFLVVALGVGCGVAGAMLRTRALHQNQLVFEDRLSVTEGILQREVKARAGQARWNAKIPDPMEQKLVALAQGGGDGERKKNWWEINLPRAHNGKG